MTSLLADGLLSVRAACEWLDVDRRTVWRMMDGGELPFVYAKGKGSLSRRIPKAALLAWASKRLIGAPAND